MNSIYNFLLLIRYKNLIIIALTHSLIKFFLINPYISSPALSIISFIIFLFSLLTIVAGGYVINDIYDVENDIINKPETRVVGLKIKKETALKSYFILSLLGLLSSIYVSYSINKLWYCLIFIFFIYSLWKYSKNYKTSFVFGNFQVAFLTALSIFTLAIYDIISSGINIENSTKTIFNIILIYCGFSFITTLIREILKDLEDIKGDTSINANTLAINFGKSKTKKIVSLLIIVPIVGIGFFQYFQYSVLSTTFSTPISYWGINIISSYYTLLLQLLLVALLIKTNLSESELDFHHSSSLCKIIMIVGILSIPLNHFLYRYGCS